MIQPNSLNLGSDNTPNSDDLRDWIGR